MNIKKTNIKTETYQLTSHFYVDAQEDIRTANYTSFFLYHENFGIKDHIVGLDVKDYMDDLGLETIEEVIECIIDEVDLYTYYKDYIENGWINKEDAIATIKADFDISRFEEV